MSHLDEGQLHMVLDGALDLLGEGPAAEVRTHLEMCGDCRTRLEVEAEVRGRAHSILDEVGLGSLELPPFEELRREASGRTAARERRLPRSVVLAWAASVVLALGAGLYGPELWEGSRGVSPVPPSPERREAPARPRDRAEVETESSGASAEKVELPAVPSEEPAQPAESPTRTDSPGLVAGKARVQSADGAGIAAAQPSEAREARSAEDERAVPGLPVLGVEELGEGTARIRQALPGGDTLVVLYVPFAPRALSRLGDADGPLVQPMAEGRDRAPAGGGLGASLLELPSGWTRVTIVRESPRAFTVLQAPRSRDYLEELAARFR